MTRLIHADDRGDQGVRVIAECINGQWETRCDDATLLSVVRKPWTYSRHAMPNRRTYYRFMFNGTRFSGWCSENGTIFRARSLKD